MAPAEAAWMMMPSPGYPSRREAKNNDIGMKETAHIEASSDLLLACSGHADTHYVRCTGYYGCLGFRHPTRIVQKLAYQKFLYSHLCSPLK